MQVKSISFKGQIIENPVLDKCLKRFTPTYLKEYQELKTIAESSYDRHVFVPYERTEAYKENKQSLDYTHSSRLIDREIDK